MASTVRCLRKGSSVWTLHSGSWPSPGPRAARRRTSPRLPRAAPGDLGSAIVRDHGVAANHAEVVGHRVPAAAPDRVSLRGRHREVDAVVAHVAAIAVPDIAVAIARPLPHAAGEIANAVGRRRALRRTSDVANIYDTTGRRRAVERGELCGGRLASPWIE